MQTKKFQKTKENFICEHCGANVVGTGYTNHCPQCLWAKHVDINPGDRLAECQGMMQPLSVELKHGEWIILHSCERCGFKRKNKSASNDSIDALTKLNNSL